MLSSCPHPSNLCTVPKVTNMEFTFRNNLQNHNCLAAEAKVPITYLSTCLLALYANSCEAEWPWKTWRAKIPLQVQIGKKVNDDNSI